VPNPKWYILFMWCHLIIKLNLSFLFSTWKESYTYNFTHSLQEGYFPNYWGYFYHLFIVLHLGFPVCDFLLNKLVISNDQFRFDILLFRW
jgi:hypothetical protein